LKVVVVPTYSRQLKSPAALLSEQVSGVAESKEYCRSRKQRITVLYRYSKLMLTERKKSPLVGRY
jgi:hypothetical protein